MARLDLGTHVRCGDAVVGELADLVVDPTTKRITHLVVKPHSGNLEARLVPIALAEPEAGEELALTCTAEELAALPNVEEYAYLRLGELPPADPDWDVGVTDFLAMPYYPATEYGGYVGEFDQNVGVKYDRIPKGEVEIRRSSSVVSADGSYVGDVDGFVVDGDHITHVVLEHGHLWGKREVTVPIGAVARVESDTVTLELSKDEVGALPERKIHRWHL
jgi:sporulation protein YlmC with PRC-barrel domain